VRRTIDEFLVGTMQCIVAKGEVFSYSKDSELISMRGRLEGDGVED